MMTLRFLALCFILISTAYARCLDSYQLRFNEVEALYLETYEGEKEEALWYELGPVLSSSAVAITTGNLAGGGGPLASTAAGGGMVVSLGIGITIANQFTHLEAPALRDQMLIIQSALRLLREGEVGNGELVQIMMPKVWQEVSSEISPALFAATIRELDLAEAFCQNEELDNFETIVDKSILKLKE